jgi:hypothetical protein
MIAMHTVRYWTAAIELALPDTSNRFALVLSGPSALRRMFLPPIEPADAR